MTWLLIAIIAAIVLFFLVRKKSTAETGQPTLRPESESPEDNELFAVISAAITEFEGSEISEDELLAIVAAAVAEFEGGGEFQVLSIRQSGRNWAFTGRQQLMQGRL